MGGEEGNGVAWGFDGEGAVLLVEKFVDFVVVSSGVGLITEEVNLVVVGQELQAVCLVPTNRKDVETNLSANRVLQPVIRKPFGE